MNIEKLELRKIKVSKFASEETYCFESDLYFDDQPLAIISNNGRGGSDRIEKHPKCNFDFLEKMREIDKYFSKLDAEKTTLGDYEFTMQPSLEIWVCDQISKHLIHKELKRKLKRKLLLLIDGKVYEQKFEFEEEEKKRDPDVVILNNIPEIKALDLYIKHTG
jgi:hypothetical protein